jgi:membrane protein DedA with SNARE-associated domain
MSSLPPILLHSLAVISYFKYLLIFLGAIIEGPILTVASGFLLRQGIFNPLFLFLALATGDLTADIGWYYIGYFFAEPALKKHGKFLGLTPDLFEKIKSIFYKKHSVILFISKITMGFGLALGTLMVAGAIRISLRSYLFYNTLGEIIYVGLLMFLGYYLGQLYGTISTGLELISLLGTFLAIGLAIYGFAQYIKSQAIKL